jgi:hypothetical protein
MDLKQAITHTVILTCHETSNTQLRQRCLRAIKILPVSQEIKQLVYLRVKDASAITRELCLDILQDSDIKLLISLSQDRSLTVRQKVVSILAKCLESHTASADVMVLLANQSDTNLRQKVVKSLASVFQDICKQDDRIIHLLTDVNCVELWQEVFQFKPVLTQYITR